MTGRPAFGLHRVLVDTSAYYAIAASESTRHGAAVRILRGLDGRPTRLFTTNYILAEIHALLLIRRGRDLAARVLREIDQSPTAIVRVSYRDEQRAREIIHRYDDKNFSLTDATSFAVMERLRIPTAFSFDHNFVQYGLQLLDS
ncbi:MAG TPA: PIN domain-containing protein [Chloroflexota bacterium]|nr:PIN domain-containing protein [Chloroflexota bacterium]